VTRGLLGVVLFVLALAACVRSESVVCSSGRLCPAATECDEVHDACIVAEQRVACSGLDEGMTCTWSTGAGACLDGVCLPHFCGDGRRSGPERCDPTDPATQTTTCNSVELGYYETAPVSCAADCQWDTSPCSEHCGDGVLNGNELCEEGVPPARTCFDYGFDRGNLSCAACGPGFADCHLIGWTRRVVPAAPGPAVIVGDDVFVALTATGIGDLAAHLQNGAWVGLGTHAGIETTAQATAIAATTANNVWVGGATGAGSGDLGFAARWDAATWTRVRTFPGVVRAMWAHGTHVFVVAGFDVLVYDGAAWTSQALATTATQFWISGTSSDDVWIGGGKLWHGGAAQAFAEETLPAVGTVSGVSAFAPNQVAVAVYETTPTRLTLRVRENGTWRAAPWLATGQKQGVPYARSATDIFMLVIDIGASPLSRVGHHNGTSWVGLTESTMRPSSMAGAPTKLIAFEQTSSSAWHYEGSAWTTLPDFDDLLPVYGPRHDAVFGIDPGNAPFRTLVRFNGNTWVTEPFARGRSAAIPRGAAFAVEQATGFTNSRVFIWSDAGSSWGTDYNTPLAGGQLTEWIGVLGASDVFLKQVGPHYLHWNGSPFPVTFSTTNIPDGTVLDSIECRPTTGCYAISATEVWFTPGDRNAWDDVTAPAIGSMNALAVSDGGFAAIGGTQGRIGRFVGGNWVIDQLPTASPIMFLVATSATDMFAVAVSSALQEEHELFHWNGTAWSRVRSPVPAVGSKIRQLWTDGRVTYLGGGTGISTHFHALVRTEPW
jgi:hypothetical protein